MAFSYPDYYRPESSTNDEATKHSSSSAFRRQLLNCDGYAYCFTWIRQGSCSHGGNCKYRHEMPDEAWIRWRLPDMVTYPPQWYRDLGLSGRPAGNIQMRDTIPPPPPTPKPQAAASSGAEDDKVMPASITPPSKPLEAADEFLLALSETLSTARAADTQFNSYDSAQMDGQPIPHAMDAASTSTTIVVSPGTQQTRKSKSKSKAKKSRTSKATQTKTSARYEDVSASTQRRRDLCIQEIKAHCGTDHTLWLPTFAVPIDVVDTTNEFTEIVFKDSRHWPTKLLEHVRLFAKECRGNLTDMHEWLQQALVDLPENRQAMVKGSTSSGVLYELIGRARFIAPQIVTRAPSVAPEAQDSPYLLRNANLALEKEDIEHEEAIQPSQERGRCARRRKASEFENLDDNEQLLPATNREQNEQTGGEDASPSTGTPPPKRVKLAQITLPTPPTTTRTDPTTSLFQTPAAPLQPVTPLMMAAASPRLCRDNHNSPITGSPDVSELERLQQEYELAEAKLVFLQKKAALEAAKRKRQ